MNNPKITDKQPTAETGKATPTLRPRTRALPAFLAMTAIVVLAGCVSDGSYGGYYGYPGPYRSGGYYYGGFHRGYSYGIQHGFGRSGFGHGGFGGGRRH